MWEVPEIKSIIIRKSPVTQPPTPHHPQSLTGRKCEAQRFVLHISPFCLNLTDLKRADYRHDVNTGWATFDSRTDVLLSVISPPCIDLWKLGSGCCTATTGNTLTSTLAPGYVIGVWWKIECCQALWTPTDSLAARQKQYLDGLLTAGRVGLSHSCNPNIQPTFTLVLPQ